MNPQDLPVDRFCHLVWYFMTKDAEKQSDVDTLRAKMWQPPDPSVEVLEGPWSAAGQMAAFAALKASVK